MRSTNRGPRSRPERPARIGRARAAGSATRSPRPPLRQSRPRKLAARRSRPACPALHTGDEAEATGPTVKQSESGGSGPPRSTDSAWHVLPNALRLQCVLGVSGNVRDSAILARCAADTRRSICDCVRTVRTSTSDMLSMSSAETMTAPRRPVRATRRPWKVSSASEPSTSCTTPTRTPSVAVTGVPYTMERHEIGDPERRLENSEPPVPVKVNETSAGLGPARWITSGCGP